MELSVNSVLLWISRGGAQYHVQSTIISSLIQYNPGSFIDGSFLWKATRGKLGKNAFRSLWLGKLNATKKWSHSCERKSWVCVWLVQSYSWVQSLSWVGVKQSDRQNVQSYVADELEHALTSFCQIIITYCCSIWYLFDTNLINSI